MAFKKQSGFTLLEIMISIVILTFMMASVYQITSHSLDTKDMVLREDRAFLQVERALERIGLDFTEIYSPLYFSFRLQQQASAGGPFGNVSQRPTQPRIVPSEKFSQATQHGLLIPTFETPDPSTFVFFSTSNRRKVQNDPESHYAWIRYSLMQMEESDDDPLRSEARFRLVRQVEAREIYNSDHVWGDVQEQTLLNYIKSLRFLFWNPSRQNWASSLNELGENRDRLLMLKVELEWIDELGVEHEFKRIFRPHWTRYDPSIDQAAYLEVQRANQARQQREQNGRDSRGQREGGDSDDF